MSEALQRQPYEQLKAYTNSLLRMMYDHLPKEYDVELKQFLSTKIDFDLNLQLDSGLGSSNNPEKDDSDNNLKFWGGDRILPQLVAWSRRILLLDVLHRMIKQFKTERQAYLERPPNQ